MTVRETNFFFFFFLLSELFLFLSYLPGSFNLSENCTDQNENRIHLNFSDRYRGTKPFKEGLYHPFRFRIQALTVSFIEEIKRTGFFPDDERLSKKAREYLWSCRLVVLPCPKKIPILTSLPFPPRFIKRFNEDNKKLKSKGTLIWLAEAVSSLSDNLSLSHFFQSHFVCVLISQPRQTPSLVTGCSVSMQENLCLNHLLWRTAITSIPTHQRSGTLRLKTPRLCTRPASCHPG